MNQQYRQNHWLLWAAQNEKTLLLCIVVIAAALRIVLWTGVTAADDLHLASASLRWLDEGLHIPAQHLALRTGLTLPLSAIFAVFGVGEWQMTIIPFLSSLLLIISAAYIAKYFFGSLAGMMTAFTIAVFPLDVFFATKFYSDIPFGALSAAAIALFLCGRNGARPLLMSVLSGTVWGYAYLVKIEAVFLSIVYLSLFLEKENRKYVVYSAIACGAVFLAESLIYWANTGEILYRLNVIMETSDKSFEALKSSARLNEELFFIKSWFITFYLFGVHYFFVVAGIIFLLIKRPRGFGLLCLWIAVMLFWLQFGGNPFADDYAGKTKLARYCSYITAPVMISVGCLLSFLLNRGKGVLGVVSIVFMTGAGLYFSIFNMASTEREIASKRAISEAASTGYSPIVMDGSSFTIARFLARSQPETVGTLDIRSGLTVSNLEKLFGHDADDLSQVYLLINPGFVAFREFRYVDADAVPPLRSLHQCAKAVSRVENPLPRLVYGQVWTLQFLGSRLPGVGPKIKQTGETILGSDDALVFAASAETVRCLAEEQR